MSSPNNDVGREGPYLSDLTTTTGTATVVTGRIHFNTKGHADTVNLTEEVRRFVTETGLSDGAVTVFFPGATGAITTLEFEPGVVQDFANLFERIASPHEHYEHNVTHADVNGHAHVRAGLLGPSLVSPLKPVGFAWAAGRRSASCASTTDPGNGRSSSKPSVSPEST